MKYIFWYLKSLPLRIWYYFQKPTGITHNIGLIYEGSIICIDKEYFLVKNQTFKNGFSMTKIKRIIKPYERKK